MARIDVDDDLWAGFLDLCRELDIADPVRYLDQWIRRGIKLQRAVDGRYWPVACALLTSGEDEILLVGNEYVKGQPLAWNLPGGAAEPGEDLYETVRRELVEECGLKALRVGRLDWLSAPGDVPRLYWYDRESVSDGPRQLDGLVPWQGQQ